MRYPYRDFVSLTRKMVVVKVEADRDDDTVVTANVYRWTPGEVVKRWFGLRSSKTLEGFWSFSGVAKYVGDCTVWHSAHTGQRAGSGIEGWLADVWAMARKNGDIK